MSTAKPFFPYSEFRPRTASAIDSSSLLTLVDVALVRLGLVLPGVEVALELCPLVHDLAEAPAEHFPVECEY